jgi:hypothetical protein
MPDETDETPGMVYVMNRYTRSVKVATACILVFGLNGCALQTQQTMVTIADARVDKAHFIDIGQSGDSVGDVLTFDQPLLDENMNPVGNNSGVCIRTQVGHSFQCQWTLTLDGGTIQVAGREFDQGISHISIVGGTGKYAGISGEMQSVNNKNGTFTQTLRYRIERRQ